MKNFFSIWLLILFACRLYAQTASKEEQLLYFFQKDSVAEIEKLIDTAKQLSSTDSSIALNILRAAAIKSNRQQIFYLEAQVYFEAGDIYYAYRNTIALLMLIQEQKIFSKSWCC